MYEIMNFHAPFSGGVVHAASPHSLSRISIPKFCQHHFELGNYLDKAVGTYVAGLFFSFAQGLKVGYTCSLLEAVLALGTYFTLL
jgi:hypothetical protein